MPDNGASKIPIPAAGTMSPPVIPERRSSKRVAAESMEGLQASRKKTAKKIKESKERLWRDSSYDAEYVNLSN